MPSDAELLQAVASKWQQAGRKVWDKAAADALEYLTVVAGNNPGKTAAQILSRPDVQTMLQQPFASAAQETVGLLGDAFGEGVGVGRDIAARRLVELGSDAIGAPVEDQILGSLEKDLHALSGTLAQRVAAAFSEKDMAKAGQALQRQALWASMALEAAAKQGANRAMLAEYEAAGAMKRWRSRLASNTCKHCSALHGQVRPVNAPFSSPGMKVYGSVLLAPPRHPNCQCIIEPVFKKGPFGIASFKKQKLVITSEALRQAEPSMRTRLLSWLASKLRR